jgi:Carboxypeptidase regulatory-like domain
VRKLLALTLVLVTGSLGASVGIRAQAPAPAQLATISGTAVDAGGRAQINERVELVQGSDVVASTNTGSRGEWSFMNVKPGDYVVRLVVRGQIAGIHVSVTAGQTVANALIVASSAAVPSANWFTDLGAVGGTLVIAAAAAAVVTTIVLVTGS